MKKILLCSYRDWSNKICDKLEYHFKDYDNLIIIKCNTQEKFLSIIKDNKFDYIFFLGWSDIIDKDIVDNNFCICLHPSMLPKYRGGSPLQHQIINGEENIGVTLFKMDQHLDKGDILFQEAIFVFKDYDLSDIYDNITCSGLKGVKWIVECLYEDIKIKLLPQDDSKKTYYKRRTPEMSEIKLEDFKNLTATDIHNKVRCLQDPYPNAYIVCKNNTYLYITNTKV
jgi:methionyl-tRNA formyltransferase